MILLDTHIWIWLVTKDPRISGSIKAAIEGHLQNDLGLSVISCWEATKLVERGRLSFSISISEWMEQALDFPGIQTLRVHELPLLTVDRQILKYPHVKTFSI